MKEVVTAENIVSYYYSIWAGKGLKLPEGNLATDNKEAVQKVYSSIDKPTEWEINFIQNACNQEGLDVVLFSIDLLILSNQTGSLPNLSGISKYYKQAKIDMSRSFF